MVYSYGKYFNLTVCIAECRSKTPCTLKGNRVARLNQKYKTGCYVVQFALASYQTCPNRFPLISIGGKKMFKFSMQLECYSPSYTDLIYLLFGSTKILHRASAVLRHYKKLWLQISFRHGVFVHLEYLIFVIDVLLVSLFFV